MKRKSLIKTGLLLVFLIILGFLVYFFETQFFKNFMSNLKTAPIAKLIIPQKKEPLPWGAFSGGKVADAVEFEEKVGKKTNYLATFVHWGNENKFPWELAQFAKDNSKTLIIFWESMDYNFGSANDPRFSYKRILQGNWDKYLAEFAQSTKEYGSPVILIPFEEMNGEWYPWSIMANGNSPEEHVQAFRYVHDFFKESGNVKFGWAVNSDSVPDVPENNIERFYPGDEYVDYAGVNGFNFDKPWRTFSEIFDSTLAQLKVYQKPTFIFSTACAQGPQKAAWIKDAFDKQIFLHPQIVGWIWFNENKEKDWRIWSDEKSLETFKSILPEQ
jgi:hypothetical protein